MQEKPQGKRRPIDRSDAWGDMKPGLINASKMLIILMTRLSELRVVILFHSPGIATACRPSLTLGFLLYKVFDLFYFTQSTSY